MEERKMLKNKPSHAVIRAKTAAKELSISETKNDDIFALELFFSLEVDGSGSLLILKVLELGTSLFLKLI